MSRPARVRTGVLATMFLLLFATAAFSATIGSYKGKTSQNRKVSLTISAGGTTSCQAAQCITGMRFKINEKCPDGHTLVDDERGFHMPIQGNRFSGSFRPAFSPHAGEKTLINGQVSGRKVTGSISSTSFSNREGRLCHGNATFTARFAVASLSPESDHTRPRRPAQRRVRGGLLVARRTAQYYDALSERMARRAAKEPANLVIPGFRSSALNGNLQRADPTILSRVRPLRSLRRKTF